MERTPGGPALGQAMAVVGAALLLAGIATHAWAGGADDRSTAEALIREIEGNPTAKDRAEVPLAKAKEALARAVRYRGAHDEAHGRLSDALAKDWAETARDLLRAAEAEDKAALVKSQALDAGAQGQRERALLEESAATVARLRLLLEGGDKGTKDAGAPSEGASSPSGARPAPPSNGDGGAP